MPFSASPPHMKASVFCVSEQAEISPKDSSTTTGWPWAPRVSGKQWSVSCWQTTVNISKNCLHLSHWDSRRCLMPSVSGKTGRWPCVKTVKGMKGSWVITGYFSTSVHLVLFHLYYICYAVLFIVFNEMISSSMIVFLHICRSPFCQSQVIEKRSQNCQGSRTNRPL